MEIDSNLKKSGRRFQILHLFFDEINGKSSLAVVSSLV